MGLTGWPASVIRAGTMAILYIFGQYREKKIDPWNIVGCTAFGFLLFQPHSLFDLGFQLSFSAVVGILYVISRKPIIEVKFKRIGKWCENTKFRHIFDLFLVTMGAQLGTFIPISFYFGQIPVFAWIANLLIVPLLPVIMISGIVLSFTGLIWLSLGQIIAWPVWFLLTYLIKVIDYLSAVPLAAYEFKSVSWVFLIGYYVILAWVYVFYSAKN